MIKISTIKKVYVLKRFVKQLLFNLILIFMLLFSINNNKLYGTGYYETTIRIFYFGFNDGEFKMQEYLSDPTEKYARFSFKIIGDYIYILDVGNYRIQKFNKEGNFVSKFGNINMEHFGFIDHITVDKDENYYILDRELASLAKYNNSGNKIFAICSKGDGLNKFYFVDSIDVDEFSNIFISEISKIEKFDRDGNYLHTFESRNGSFSLDKDSNILFIGQEKLINPNYPTSYQLTPPTIKKCNNDGILVGKYPFNIDDGEPFIEGVDSKGNIFMKFLYWRRNIEESRYASYRMHFQLFRYKLENGYAYRKEQIGLGKNDEWIAGNSFKLQILSNDEIIVFTSYMLPPDYERIGGYRLLKLSKIINVTPSWSPDSTKILFETNYGGRWNVNTQMLGGIFGISTDSDVSARNASWNADMTKVVYVSQKDGNWNVYYRTIGTSAVGSPVQVTNTTGDETSPYFSPDMTKVLYGSNESGKWHIYEKVLSTGAVKQLTSGNYDEIHGRYAPDGNKIVYASKKGGSNWDIYVKDMETNVERKITQGSADKLYPCWSPDCKKIAYCSNEVYTGTPGNPDGEWKLYVLDNLTGTGTPARIVGGLGNHRMPDWSKNGMKIAFVSDGEYFEDIYVINADGTGQVWRVTQ